MHITNPPKYKKTKTQKQQQKPEYDLRLTWLSAVGPTFNDPSGRIRLEKGESSRGKGEFPGQGEARAGTMVAEVRKRTTEEKMGFWVK